MRPEIQDLAEESGLIVGIPDWPTERRFYVTDKEGFFESAVDEEELLAYIMDYRLEDDFVREEAIG